MITRGRSWWSRQEDHGSDGSSHNRVFTWNPIYNTHRLQQWAGTTPKNSGAVFRETAASRPASRAPHFRPLTSSVGRGTEFSVMLNHSSPWNSDFLAGNVDAVPVVNYHTVTWISWTINAYLLLKEFQVNCKLAASDRSSQRHYFSQYTNTQSACFTFHGQCQGTGICWVTQRYCLRAVRYQVSMSTFNCSLESMFSMITS